MPESDKNDASENGNGNGKVRKLNNTQRKELARIVERRYEAKIGDADASDRNAWEERRKKAIQQVKRDLGVEKIEQQIRDLETQKKAMGFTYADMPDSGSNAKERYEAILRQEAQEKNTLREERDAKVACIWMVETVEEAEAIVGVEATPHG